MGPCQGRFCHLNSIRVYARENRMDEATVGHHDRAPPVVAGVAVAARRPAARAGQADVDAPPPQGSRCADLLDRRLAAPPLLHRRPRSGGASAFTIRVGLIDVRRSASSSSKGPDAGAFLDRLYPNRFSDLKVGRIRYGVLCSDAGRIMDDGTIATALRRRVLRHDHLHRRGERLRVVPLVERRLAHGRRARERDRCRGRSQRRRPGGAQAHGAVCDIDV